MSKAYTQGSEVTKAPDPWRVRTGKQMLEQIRTHGYARVELTPSERSQLMNLFEKSKHFFGSGPEHNKKHSNEKLTNGYRPPRSAYNNGDPVNEADVNDSFLYWNARLGAEIPGNDQIPEFLDALETYRSGPAREIMNKLMKALADHYGKKEHPFEAASVLQVNSFGMPTDRKLLQTRHQDGVLATVIWASAPGLEVFVDDKNHTITFEPDEVVVMPGGILNTMTGGDIKTLYHQVRNHGPESLGRKSIMYFSCPDVHRGPVEPYIANESNEGVDIRDVIKRATDMFGLADNFVGTAVTA